MRWAKIQKITARVRDQFERGVIPYEKLKHLYLKYNPTQEIDLFLYRAQEMFPRLNCGLASLFIKDLLRYGKIINGKYERNNHTFLFIDENIIVDITADQYDGPPVFVGPIRYPWSF